MNTQKSLVNQRRRPSQKRAQATYDAILEAAAQLLDTQGEGAFTSNRIAERAGVSIGSLYQYFPNKKAIALAIAEREEVQLTSHTLPEAGNTRESALRRGIRAYINMLPDHPKTRKTALELVLKTRSPAEIGQNADKRFREAGAFNSLTDTECFVVSRAIMGVVQSAVLEERTDLASDNFEDALFRLACSLIRAD